eukprot:27848-Prymnesium_polylepis.1
MAGVHRTAAGSWDFVGSARPPHTHASNPVPPTTLGHSQRLLGIVRAAYADRRGPFVGIVHQKVLVVPVQRQRRSRGEVPMRHMLQLIP